MQTAVSKRRPLVSKLSLNVFVSLECRVSAQVTGKGNSQDQSPLLLVLDLQNGRVVVQDGQDDFVHVLSQT